MANEVELTISMNSDDYPRMDIDDMEKAVVDNWNRRATNVK